MAPKNDLTTSFLVDGSPERDFRGIVALILP